MVIYVVALKDTKEKLEEIESLLDVDEILSTKIDNKRVKDYYNTNSIAYKIFHNSKGFIHCGISYDGKHKDDDFMNQARYIERLISDKKPMKILELGGGTGANSAFLAKRKPNSEFTVSDISEKNLKKQKARTKRLDNLKSVSCDFHDLSQFKGKKFDVIFMIETLCHAEDKEKVVSEISNVLNEGGRFILIDGFYERPPKTEIEKKVARLMEIGMSVGEFESYTRMKRFITKNNMKIEEEIDWSDNVIPSMMMQERRAKRFFESKFISKLLIRILPGLFYYNALSGYLMPNSVKEDIATYNLICAIK